MVPAPDIGYTRTLLPAPTQGTALLTSRDRRQHKLFVALVLLSLLLHLLLAVFVEYWSGSGPPATATTQPPLEVDLRQIPVRPRELDLPPPPTETTRTRPAKRLAPDDRQVERERAPVGTTPEEGQPNRPAETVTRPAPAKSGVPAATGPPSPTRPGTLPAPPPAVSREQLLASSSQAARNVAAEQVREWRQKLREEVERGEAIWLDTEKDLLVSFFKRFRDGIYLVWHYPQAAAARGEDGICLLKITINRAGIVEDVQIIDSSGSPLLDEAAVAAVHNATRYYGYLPASYPGETLTIFAFFQYQLGGRGFIYGAD
ncbi:MAG TPA: hypothetical protein DEB35_10855 [Desulfuromonas sp.]|nr:hypothetical protein [Desulfuromonas sp.]